jgi:hypothetical protein
MAAIGAGVLGVLCLSSSVYAAMSGGGGEETPALAPTPVIPDTQNEDETGSASVVTPKVITGSVKGQYVRLWQGTPYQNQDAYALNILELEVYDSSGTNIAQGKSATARSQYPGDHQPVLAFDGSLDTKYRSNYDDKEDWLEVDLGSVIDIHKIVIRHPDEMLPNGVYTLRGGRGSKLCADEGNRVICNRDAVGAWEKFTINKEGDKYSLRGGRNGKLCADEGDKIVCNRDAVLGWEKFTVEKHGDKFSLKGGRNQKYCADDSHTVQCNRDAVLGWEKFTLTAI